MFKKSRKKIVASIMTILVLVWIGTLSIIYLTSYFEMTKHNKEMINTHAQMYQLPKTPENLSKDLPKPDFKGAGPNPKFIDSPMFRLTTFYTVALSYEGSILETINNQPFLHTNDDLEMYAQDIISKSKTSGTRKNLRFLVTDKNGYLLVTFMDNTVMNENAAMLFKNTVIFGFITLIVFFFFSRYLAKKIVQPLEESDQKQKQFISDAGHELKTPVSVVSANVELLLREIGDNQWLNNIQYENERMGVLIRQLLDLAHAQNPTPVMEEINFSRLCNGEILPFEGVAFEKGLHMESQIENQIFLSGNSPQLKQLISILIDNAISHSNMGHTISISLSKEHNFRNPWNHKNVSFAKLIVQNPGKEIPSEQLEHIFERFYRIDSVRNSQSGHYGLGLAIAKEIVTSHQGKINVQCHDDFVDFIILLPIIENNNKN